MTAVGVRRPSPSTLEAVSSLKQRHKMTHERIETQNGNETMSSSRTNKPNIRRRRSRVPKRCTGRRLLLFIGIGGFIQILFMFWGHSRISSAANEATKNISFNPSYDAANQVHKGSSKLSYYREPTHHACDGYRGIYHIEKGDIGGAAGTVFFQFVIGQIIWAERHNFKPWVHLNNVSYVIYDPAVHGRGAGLDFDMMSGLSISYVRRPDGHWKDAYPGEPTNFEGLKKKHFHLDGMGVWEDYFEPISDFVPGDRSCEDKPLVTMDLYLITPGVHGFAPWAPRCWRYEYLPDYVTKPHIPLNEWLEPQRHIAHDVLTRYIEFKPEIHHKAEEVNPSCSLKNSCLGLHIRQSDKAAGRRVVQTDEFLPFAEAFVASGGKWIYLATDSDTVMEHIKTQWPKQIRDKIRSMGDEIVRSNDHQAVFDIASHHRTNTEILIEILALAKCQFMVHGLSAVTETSIWIDVNLHYTSVNLEDPEHLASHEFSHLVKHVLGGGNATQMLLQKRPRDWWKQESPPTVKPTHKACEGFNGILLITKVGEKVGAGTAFFNSILNQIYYAEQYNLKPFVHIVSDSGFIDDEEIYRKNDIEIVGMIPDVEISVERNAVNSTFVFPGAPLPAKSSQTSPVRLPGDGIWNHFFDPVSDFVPGDESCTGKPLVSLDTKMIKPGIHAFAPWSIRPWRNDDVPDDIWNPNNVSLSSWMEPMRAKAHDLTQKYIKFRPHLLRRAQEVNPVNRTTSPCMAVHLRNTDKGKNKYRSKFPVNRFKEYFKAFIRAGGETIYVATDSHKVLEFIEGHFPTQVKRAIKTQGTYVVRSTQKWPIHYLENHHRTNSEALVDVIAMSKCELMLNGHSTLSEAAIYLNPRLHNRNVNWEDPDHMSVEQFEQLAQSVLGTSESPPVKITEEPVAEKSVQAVDTLVNATVLKGDGTRQCRKNAIIYLAQKKHSTYKRDSYGILLQSLDLVHKNYLSLNDHKDNTDLIIFHTADFTQNDIEIFGQKYGNDFKNLLQLVDLQDTKYWTRPHWHKDDNMQKWYAYPLFSEGYRKMMHWFAIDIWQYFADYAKTTGCEYEYVMRFDEDSFLHSPIKYDVFDFMKRNDYYYGFRLCSYEMQVTQRIWKLWRQHKGSPEPIRDVDLEMCGVYNNFFVAKISFFQSSAVQKFLRFVDRQGLIYRRRLGDLMIHSMTIYAFAPSEKIHRFLDFSYEHATVDKNTGCVMWGGLQVGYDDPNSDQTMDRFVSEKVTSKNCQANLTMLGAKSLSPTYAHLPSRFGGKVALKTAMAGRVELPGRGLLSG